MTIYYFDLRDGDELVADGEGVELRDMRAVQKEAARALAGFAWDILGRFNGAQSHRMAIEVRSRRGPVMEIQFSFLVIRQW
jgi:hypothetical protein